MALVPDVSLWGLLVSGDWGPFTIYTKGDGQKVVFPISPPTKPPSPDQIVQRNLFASAQASWTRLTPDEKQALEDAARKASLIMTGQNVWMSCWLRRDPYTLEGLQDQTGVQLPQLPASRT